MFNLIKANTTYWKDFPETAGLYLILFPNGMKYVGETKNLKYRIHQHEMALFKELTMPERDNHYQQWYSKAVKCFNNKDWHFCNEIEIYYQITENKEAASLLEREALKEIQDNKSTNIYYNSSYPCFCFNERKRVHCQNTGRVYRSLEEAAFVNHFTYYDMKYHLMGYTPLCGGKKFTYID